MTFKPLSDEEIRQNKEALIREYDMDAEKAMQLFSDWSNYIAYPDSIWKDNDKQREYDAMYYYIEQILNLRIEKQVNHVEDVGNGNFYHYECPNCGSLLGYSRRHWCKKCSECGQALDWGEGLSEL